MICRANTLPCVLLLLTVASCAQAGDRPDENVGVASSDQSELFHYHREYVFLAPSPEGAVVVPFDFQATQSGGEIEREVRAWLARGEVWDRFLEESTLITGAAGVWRVVPQGDLRIRVRDPGEVETLRYDSGDRQLRVDLHAPLTQWIQGGDSRFRLLRARLMVGSEVVSGSVLEQVRIERTLEDGWPPGQDFDSLFLTTGDSIQLVIAETLSGGGEGEGYAWVRVGETERTWSDGEVRWLEVEPYQPARREVPVRWRFRVPGAQVDGELTRTGFDAFLGPEREGRRAVEIRYTVDGWVEIQGARRDVVGTIRHTQQ